MSLTIADIDREIKEIKVILEELTDGIRLLEQKRNELIQHAKPVSKAVNKGLNGSGKHY